VISRLTLSNLLLFFALATGFIYLLGAKLLFGLNVEYTRALFSVTVFLILSVVLFKRRKIHYSKFGVLFAYLILGGTLASLIKISTGNLLTIMRFSVFALIWFSDINISIKQLKLLVSIYVAVNFLILIYQYLVGDYEYINMTYRYSGIYYHHSSGASLMYQVLLGTIFLFRKFWHQIILSSLLAAFIILTGSRTGLGALLLFYLLFFYRSQYKFLYFGILIILTPVVFNYIAGLPRISFLLEKGLVDASTLERVNIFKRSIININGISHIVGIGSGYFDDLQFRLVGEKVAAHNLLLQMYVEGGIIGLLLFINALVFLFLKSAFKSRMMLYLVVVIELFGIINNVYYYFEIYMLYILLLKSNINPVEKVRVHTRS